MDIEQILGIKGMKTLKNALPRFCRRFGFLPQDGWEILKNHDGDLETLISQARSNILQVRNKPRGGVNAWWSKFHKDFDSLGLGQFKRVSRASQAEASYELLICLAFLTERLKTKRLIVQMAERARVEKVVKPEPNVFVRIGRWFKRMLVRFLRSEGVLNE